jgi:hypothetical protein
MAAPKHPGGNAGKGRPRGVPNKATFAVREIARAYTVEAVEALAAVMRDATAPHAARVSAATALLDRGHGRPTQPLAGDHDMPPIGMTLEQRKADSQAILERAFGKLHAKLEAPTIEKDDNDDAAKHWTASHHAIST